MTQSSIDGFSTASQMLQALRQRQLSAVELLTLHQQRIERYNPRLNAIIAKVYKGASWLDGKECIVLDYSETSLVAHWIRDEIRQIEPGLYLGKVYWDKKRLIDFALKF